MSKINELRKKAAEAARKRDWAQSVRLYERVCDIDSNNPGFRNELGDVFLKMGEADKALEAFERAAEAYRGVSLHNNAVAVYKKILRHDPHHVDALWGLGELKEQQGLDTDASSHYIEFLGHAEKIPTGERQKFVNHCLLLVERYDDDLQMLSRVESIFENWNQGEDHARVLIQKARLAHSEGQDELIEKYVARAREVFSDLDLLDDYLQLQQELASGSTDDLSGEAPDESGQESIQDENLQAADAADPVDEIAVESVGGEFENEEIEEHVVEIPVDEAEELDSRAGSGGPISGPRSGIIDLGFDLDNGEPEQPEQPAAPARAARVQPGLVDLDDDAQATSTESVVEVAADSVNLLDELLSDAGFDMGAAESGQVDTIRADVGAQIAGNVAEDDHAGQYEVGLVYLDMGLHENAADAFALAAHGEEQRLKALEMRGNALRQLGRNEEALAAYQDGLQTLGHPDRFYLGLHYEIATCLEALGQYEEALQHFERAAAIDGEFLDVSDRVRALMASG